MAAYDYQFLEHTADIRLYARGKALSDLFSAAAFGMTEYLFAEQSAKLRPDQEEEIALTADDLESLLVEWLSKILFLSATNYRAYLKYDFREIDERHAWAVTASSPAEAIREIKAVTYHGLKVQNKNGFWEATITFDI